MVEEDEPMPSKTLKMVPSKNKRKPRRERGSGNHRRDFQ
jgi:hypothetical protein